MSCKNVAALNAGRKMLRNAGSLKCWGSGGIATRCVLEKSVEPLKMGPSSAEGVCALDVDSGTLLAGRGPLGGAGQTAQNLTRPTSHPCLM